MTGALRNYVLVIVARVLLRIRAAAEDYLRKVAKSLARVPPLFVGRKKNDSVVR
jgi:hypothetical protein